MCLSGNPRQLAMISHSSVANYGLSFLPYIPSCSPCCRSSFTHSLSSSALHLYIQNLLVQQHGNHPIVSLNTSSQATPRHMGLASPPCGTSPMSCRVCHNTYEIGDCSGSGFVAADVCYRGKSEVFFYRHLGGNTSEVCDAKMNLLYGFHCT